jgi:hypothetical protein
MMPFSRLGRRLRELAAALRQACTPAAKPQDAGGYTGEGPLLRSLVRDADRNRARAESADRRDLD